MPKAGIGEKIENNFCQSLQKSRREGKVEETVMQFESVLRYTETINVWLPNVLLKHHKVDGSKVILFMLVYQPCTSFSPSSYSEKMHWGQGWLVYYLYNFKILH